MLLRDGVQRQATHIQDLVGDVGPVENIRKEHRNGKAGCNKR